MKAKVVVAIDSLFEAKVLPVGTFGLAEIVKMPAIANYNILQYNKAGECIGMKCGLSFNGKTTSKYTRVNHIEINPDTDYVEIQNIGDFEVYIESVRVNRTDTKTRIYKENFKEL